MRIRRTSRPVLEPLDARRLLSHASGPHVLAHTSSHSTPATAEVVHLQGPESDDATVEGNLKSGRPIYVRVVAARDNLVNLSVESIDGGHVSARIPEVNSNKLARIIRSSSIAGSTSPGNGIPGSASVGKASAHSVTLLVKVTGQGHFFLTASALESPREDFPASGVTITP